MDIIKEKGSTTSNFFLNSMILVRDIIKINRNGKRKEHISERYIDIKGTSLNVDSEKVLQYQLYKELFENERKIII